jgi:diadenosine tetraphosphatase ApaH/serine/threonine PP2A family protein phosphatase
MQKRVHYRTSLLHRPALLTDLWRCCLHNILGCILQIRTIDRVCEIPHEGPFCDLMWSDPEDIETWAVSPRGAGWLFGRKVTSEFNNINGERVCGF